MNGFAYAFKQAWISVRRSGRSAVMSIGTITIAFITLGGFLLLSVNVQRVVDRWQAAAELSVYCKTRLRTTPNAISTRCCGRTPLSPASSTCPSRKRWNASAAISLN